MQNKNNVACFPASNPPFALVIGGVAVAQVPFNRALEACGEVIAELISRTALAGKRPNVGIRRLDSVQMKTLPPYHDARRCIDIAGIRPS
jgi:hypothetical protein